jgi:hypothetical protein
LPGPDEALDIPRHPHRAGAGPRSSAERPDLP